MNSIFVPLIDAGALVLGLALFVVLSAACEVGFRIGRWRGKSVKLSDAQSTVTSTLTGGMLALLAFMLGLTINFAQNRFEARRDLVAVEANTIGTAWLRARLVGGAEGEAIARLIEGYAKTRLEFTGAERRGPVDALIVRTGDQQDKIWRIATTVARRSPTPVTATLITALNEMFDASLSQRFAFDGRVPGAMLSLLVLGSVIAIGAMGFQMGLVGARQPVLSALLLLMWTGGMVMTVDLNRPRLGDIRVDASPLVWTIEGFQTSRSHVPSSPAP